MICRVDPRTEQIRFFSKGEEMWLPALSNSSKKLEVIELPWKGNLRLLKRSRD